MDKQVRTNKPLKVRKTNKPLKNIRWEPHHAADQLDISDYE